MSEYEQLAEALNRFFGRSDITAEMLQSFDDLDFEDKSSDFRLRLRYNTLTGDYELYTSEYFDGVLERWMKSDDIHVIEAYMETVAEELNKTKDGLDQLLKLSSTVTQNGDELDIKTGFNYASSYYVIFYGDENYTTHRPYQAAEKLSSILEESMQKWIDAVNEKLEVYRAPKIEYGQDFEFYCDGIFLSIYFSNRKTSTMTFHPGRNPVEWVQTKCDSRRKLNEALKEVHRRLA